MCPAPFDRTLYFTGMVMLVTIVGVVLGYVGIVAENDRLWLAGLILASPAMVFFVLLLMAFSYYPVAVVCLAGVRWVRRAVTSR